MAETHPYDPADSVSIGVYSYPRSGNMWLRSILAAGMGMEDVAAGVRRYLPDAANQNVLQNGWDRQGQRWFFHKTHHMVPLVDAAGAPVPVDKILYIYRDPLDVFVSYLNFLSANVGNEAGRRSGFGIDTVESIPPDRMEWFVCRWIADATLFPKNRKFGGWFESVQSFRARAAAGEPVHLIRYEDLKTDFDATVAGIFAFLGVEEVDTARTYALADRNTAQDGKMAWQRQSATHRRYLTEEQIARFAMVWAQELADIGYSYAQ
ncbi:MAG: sulfotransferase domain-containing protein [Pseudomonadota bacterium]